eukprot:gene22847-30021_t
MRSRATFLPILTLLLASCYVSALRFPDYYVIGQQKCGTSSLWKFMSVHPQLQASTDEGNKEPFYFNGAKQSAFHQEKCDNNITGYLRLWKSTPPSKLIGDHTAVLISCYCCAELYYRMNPKAKVIAVLRDPVTRSLSRFTELRKFGMKTDLPALFKPVNRHPNLGSYSKVAVQAIKDCLKVINETSPMPLTMMEVMRFRCMQTSNIVGYSVYSVFLKRWLEFFSPEQLLVIYTSEMEQDPLGTMRKVEEHLGVQQHAYPPKVIGTKFNTHTNYGWRSAEVKKPGRFLEEEQLGGDLLQLHNFFKPYMHELKEMADEGLISPMPEEMMAPYQ